MSAVMDAGAAPAPRASGSVRAIAAKEWLELRRNPRGRLLAALMAVLMLVALLGGALHHERSHAERDAAQQGDHEMWNGQGAKDPHGAAHFGQWAFKPPSLLGLADPGTDAYSGGAVWMEAHKRNDAQFRSARDSGAAARLGGLSLAFILQVVMPLVIVVLGFDAVSGERERGTLRQLLAHGLPPTALVAGKAVGMLRALLVLLAPLLAALMAAAGFMAEPGERLDAVLRALAWVVAHGVYLAGFVALALCVSSVAPSSRAALVMLLGLWLAATFFAPRLATELARAAVPLPSAQEFKAQIAAGRAKSFGHDETHPGFVAFRAEVMKQYGVQRVEDLPVNLRGLALRRDDEIGYALYDELFGRLNGQFDTQDRMRAWAGAAFPLLGLQPLSMALAGTDRHHHQHFADAAEAHRRLIQTATSDDLIRNQKHGDTSYVANQALWRSIPPFDYHPPSAAWALWQAAQPLALTLLWAALCGGAAWFAAQRLRAVASK